MIHLKYTFACSICGNSGEQTWGIRQGEQAPQPALPPEWRYVLDALVCGEHQVSIDVFLVNIHDAERPRQHEKLWREGVRL